MAFNGQLAEICPEGHQGGLLLFESTFDSAHGKAFGEVALPERKGYLRQRHQN